MKFLYNPKFQESIINGDQWSTGNFRCSCALKCFAKFSADIVEEKRAKRLGTLPDMDDSEHGKMQRAWALVASHISNPSTVSRRTKWTLDGLPVCRPWWQHAHAIGTSTVDEIKRKIEAGHDGPLAPTPMKLPPMLRDAEGAQWAKADAWFLSLYMELADPMPDTEMQLNGMHFGDGLPGGDPDFHPEEYELLTLSDHPLLALNVCLAREDGRYAPKRFLNPGVFEDLVQLHSACAPEDRVSKSTLRRVWQTRWEKLMPFRSWGQGKRCPLP